MLNVHLPAATMTTVILIIGIVAGALLGHLIPITGEALGERIDYTLLALVSLLFFGIRFEAYFRPSITYALSPLHYWPTSSSSHCWVTALHYCSCHVAPTVDGRASHLFYVALHGLVFEFHTTLWRKCCTGYCTDPHQYDHSAAPLSLLSTLVYPE